MARTPGHGPHAHVTLRADALHTASSSQLAAGAALANATAVYHVVQIHGSAKVAVRLKASVAGALDLEPIRHWEWNAESDPDGSTASAYTTGLPTQVAVSANTEALIEYTCKGEAMVRIKFVPSAGPGTVTYCDISQV